MTSEEAAEGDLRPHQSHAPTKVFPLNSKRLTSQYVMSIAKAMDLPTKGSVEATKLIIEGKLTEMSREPLNVQVVVKETDGGKVMILLRDSQGVFVEVDCSLPEEGGAKIDDDNAIGDDPGGGEDLSPTLLWMRIWPQSSWRFRLRTDSR